MKTMYLDQALYLEVFEARNAALARLREAFETAGREMPDRGEVRFRHGGCDYISGYGANRVNLRVIASHGVYRRTGQRPETPVQPRLA